MAGLSELGTEVTGVVDKPQTENLMKRVPADTFLMIVNFLEQQGDSIKTLLLVCREWQSALLNNKQWLWGQWKTLFFNQFPVRFVPNTLFIPCYLKEKDVFLRAPTATHSASNSQEEAPLNWPTITREITGGLPKQMYLGFLDAKKHHFETETQKIGCIRVKTAHLGLTKANLRPIRATDCVWAHTNQLKASDVVGFYFFRTSRVEAKPEADIQSAQADTSKPATVVSLRLLDFHK